MLETFKARLKAKSTAAGANLSPKRIDAIADRLHKKFPELAEEKDHDEKIVDFYDDSDFKEMASLDDYHRGKAAKEKADKEKADKEKADKEAADKAKSEQVDEPAWFKKYREETDAKLNAFEKEKSQGTIKSKATEKLKDVPAKFWEKRALPEKEEDLDAFITDVTKDYADFKTDMVNDGLSVYDKPKGAGGGGGAAKDKVPDSLKAWGEKQKAENAKVLATKVTT